MDIVKFLDHFVDLLKKARNLPEVLQLILLPFLLIFTLLIAPILIVFLLWLVISKFYKDIIIRGLVEQNLELLEQLRNRLVGRNEKIEELLKAQNRVENALNLILKSKLPPDKKNEHINNLQQAKIELAQAIHKLEYSTTDLQNINLQISELLQKYSQYLYHSRLTLWLVKNLPEDWRLDLEELRSEWISSGCTGIVLQLQTIQCLLEMGWAKLMIKWEDFCDGSAIKQINNRHTSN